MFFEAAWFTAFTRFVTLFFPLKTYYRWLGKPYTGIDCNKPWDLDVNDEKTINEVFKNIRRCEKYLPWKHTCLVKSLAAKKMLKKRGIKCFLLLGVFNDDIKMEAHAWIQCGKFKFFQQELKFKKNFIFQ